MPVRRISSPLITKFLLLCLALFLAVLPAISAAEPPVLPDPDRLPYPPLSFEPPVAARFTLDNGMVVHYFENRELPLLKIAAIIRAGSIHDPPGLEGLAELTATGMETGGIAGMTGNAVDEALDSMAAQLQTAVHRDYAAFSLSLLKEDLERGLALFSRILVQPVFEEEKLSLAKGLKIEELRRTSDNPQKLAFREFGRLMHAESPWGRVATNDSVGRVQREDLIRFHERFYHPERVMIAVSGDISREEAENQLNRRFASWKPTGKEAPSPPPPVSRDGGIFFIPKEIPQSIVLFGWFAPSKRHPQFYPFEILDFVLGSGGFRSRIFQEVRTNRGLAYSAGSFYTARREYGLFGAYAFTKSESTGQVISLIEEIVREVASHPLPPEELEMAKRSILNSFIFSFTGPDQIALQQLMVEYNDLPRNFLSDYRGRIERIRADEIRDAAGRHLAPEKRVLLIIGSNAVYRDLSAFFKTIRKIEGTHE